MTLKLQDTYDIIQATGDMKQMTLQEILSLNTETLLYFYPKDNTPGCTVENKDFSSLKQEFEQNGVALI
jgi:thioredoxin-dependent peroxiredoxin